MTGLISKSDSVEKLRQSAAHLVAFTARPPRRRGKSKLLPADMRRKRRSRWSWSAFPTFPLISFGRLQYLGEQRGYDPEIFLKPSPVQALAGIAAALTGDEWSALQAACDWYETGQLTGPLAQLPHSFELGIVEDTLSGIRSVVAAGEILQGAGLDVTVRTYGLTSGSAAKSAAFEQAGVPYYSDWDALMEHLVL